MVFMARKAVCFYECLNILGLSQVSTTTTSDRIFDMDLSWLRGKRVALVDDALISGTTLARLTNIALNAGAKEVTSHVFCVDTQWWASQLVSPTEPFLRLPNSDTTAFCSQLVRAISCLPHPYAVDYPIFGGLTINDSTESALFSIPGWITRDISTPLQSSKGISVLVIEPNNIASNRLQQSIGLKSQNCNRIIKIRLYGRKNEKSDTVAYRIMPIFALEPINHETLNIWWDTFTANKDTRFFAEARNLFTSYTSKLRLIQFVLATQVLRTWITELKPYANIENRINFDFASVRYAFSPEITEQIKELCAPTKAHFYHHLTTPTIPLSPNIKKPSYHECDTSPPALQKTLIQPFIDLHDNEEIRAREKTKNLTPELFITLTNDHDVLRLQRGYSVFDLQHLLSTYKLLDSNLAISLFLDSAIDRGFIVPITVDREGLVYRAYRHGEDIKDAQQFEKLVHICVGEFLSGSDDPSIGQMWLEKLMVLLLQRLVERHIIAPSDVALGSVGTLGVRYAAYGPIVKSSARKIYSHYDGEYYSKRLERDKIILNHQHFTLQEQLFEELHEEQHPLPKKFPKKKFNLGIQPKYVPSNHDGETLSQQIGNTIGVLKKGFLGTKISIDQFVHLLTSLTLETLGPAIAVELDIFSIEWRSHGRIMSLTYEKAIQYFTDTSIKRYIGIRNDLSYDAITSGRRKAWAYYSGSARNISLTIEQQLQGIALSDKNDIDNANRTLAKYILLEWRQLWQSKLPGELHSKKSVEYLEVLKATILIYQINIWLRFLEISVDTSSTNDNKYLTELQTLIQELNTICNENPEPAINFTDVLLKINDAYASTHDTIQNNTQETSPDFRFNLYRTSLANIDTFIQQTHPQLEAIELVFAAYGKPHDIVRQRHLLVIQYKQDLNVPKDPVFFVSNLIKNLGIDNTSLSIKSDFIGKGETVCIFSSNTDDLENLFRLAVTVRKQTWSRKNINWICLFGNIPRDERPAIDTLTKELRGFALSQRILSCKKILITPESSFSVQLIVPETTAESPLSLSASENSFVTFNQHSTTLTEPYDRLYTITEYREMQLPIRKKIGTDILVISMTSTEHAGILNTINSCDDFVETSRFTEYSFSVPGHNNSKFIVKYFPLFQQGNVAIASAVSKLVSIHKPSIVAVIGMAGAIGQSKDSSNILDVVIANQVIYYEAAKDTASGLHRRGDVFNLDQKLSRAVHGLLSEGDGGVISLISKAEENNAPFRVVTAPILCGEKVVTYSDADVKKWAHNFNDKVEAVETEAWGAIWGADRAYNFEQGKPKLVRSLIFRGVADRADVQKNKIYQKIATANAMQAFLLFISKIDPSYLGLYALSHGN